MSDMAVFFSYYSLRTSQISTNYYYYQVCQNSEKRTFFLSNELHFRKDSRNGYLYTPKVSLLNHQYFGNYWFLKPACI